MFVILEMDLYCYQLGI